jgi:uncharacterized membrane protein YeaQ/YmgE (transglycosylase-associated protein family)
MELVWTILIGLLVGVVAKAIMPGANPQGFWLTAALGIGGSIVASYVGHVVGFYRAGQGAGFIGALVGAVALIWVYNKFIKKR